MFEKNTVCAKNPKQAKKKKKKRDCTADSAVFTANPLRVYYDDHHVSHNLWSSSPLLV